MVEKTKTVVKIGNREYTVLAAETEEYIHKVALYVNRKMDEVAQKQPNLSTIQIAFLTAINLGDQVLKLQERIDELQKEVTELKKSAKKQPQVFDVSKRGSR